MRKLWSAMFPHALDLCRTRFESKVQAYRWVRNEWANWECRNHLGQHLINIYVDERDGQGWRLYEQIDLRKRTDGGTRVEKNMADLQPHPRNERCYDCATDEELEAAFAGLPHPTIHFGDGTGVPCPFTAATQEKD